MNHFAVNNLLDLLLSPSLNKKLINPLCKAFRGILNKNKDLIADILVAAALDEGPVAVSKERALSLICKITSEPIRHLMEIMQLAKDYGTYELACHSIKILGENSRNENIAYLLSDDFLSALSRTDHDKDSIYTQTLSTLLGLKEIDLSFNELKSKLFDNLILGLKPNRAIQYRYTLAQILNADPYCPRNQEIIAKMRKSRDTFGTIAETWKLLNDRSRKGVGDVRELVESMF